MHCWEQQSENTTQASPLAVHASPLLLALDVLVLVLVLALVLALVLLVLVLDVLVLDALVLDVLVLDALVLDALVLDELVPPAPEKLDVACEELDVLEAPSPPSESGYDGLPPPQPLPRERAIPATAGTSTKSCCLTGLRVGMGLSIMSVCDRAAPDHSMVVQSICMSQEDRTGALSRSLEG